MPIAHVGSHMCCFRQKKPCFSASLLERSFKINSVFIEVITRKSLKFDQKKFIFVFELGGQSTYVAYWRLATFLRYFAAFQFWKFPYSTVMLLSFESFLTVLLWKKLPYIYTMWSIILNMATTGKYKDKLCCRAFYLF